MSLRAVIAFLLCVLTFGGGAAAFEGRVERAGGGGDYNECCCDAQVSESSDACAQTHAPTAAATENTKSTPAEGAAPTRRGCAPCGPCNAPAPVSTGLSVDRVLTAQTRRLKARRKAADDQSARIVAIPFYAPFLTAISPDDVHAFAKAQDPTPTTRLPPLRVIQCRFLI